MRSAARFSLLAVVASSAALAAPSTARAGDMSGRDVMVKNEQARKNKELTATATLSTGAEGQETKSKTFSMWRKLGSDGAHSKSLTRFSAPAEVRGEAILFEENANSENDVQLYLPRFKKIRRVEAQSQSSSFMGSAFSYTDMTAAQVDDYKHTLLRSEPCPNDAKVSCFVVESIPTAEGAKSRTSYSKSIGWVRSDNFLLQQGESFDKEGQLWKRVVSSDFREVDPAAHKIMAHTVRVDDLKGKRFSILSFKEVKTNAGIPDSTFTQQSLSRE